MSGHASYALGTATFCPFSGQADSLATGLVRRKYARAIGQKKRPQPKIGPDDWAEAKSKVGQRAREEDMRSAIELWIKGGGDDPQLGVAMRGPKGGGDRSAPQQRVDI